MLEDISGEQIKEQFKSNKTLRLSVITVGGLLVVVLGFFIYRQFVWSPANEESKDAYWPGLNLAVADSTDAALDELRVVVNKNDGKIGGEIAQFVYARQLMAKGEFAKAIEELEGVDVSDTYVAIMAQGLIADCYSEQEKYSEAAEKYISAADMVENEMTTPMYLMKAGLCAEEIKNFETAKNCYSRIMDDFPTYAAQNYIEKYLARVSSKGLENGDS